MEAVDLREARMPGSNDRDEQKRIIKEAIHDWLDEQFRDFGKWSFYGIAAAVFAALIYWVLAMNGFHR